MAEDTGSTWARLPGSVRIHLVLTAIAALIHVDQFFPERPVYGAEHARLEWGLIVTIVVYVGIAALYALVIGRVDWARIVLGIVTLPVGLILLLAPSARRYTGDRGSLASESGILRAKGDDE